MTDNIKLDMPEEEEKADSPSEFQISPSKPTASLPILGINSFDSD